ncbi:hypothetical protein B0J11DRAFT_543152 [Dendryphion nanum]|uniref:Nitrogen regulatory protein areA GATA-like domain-containing protein n=1 Tax=Dendryphion nanum TaxID=256645 RepID=A0A9P9I8F6_9PLEO|nr:hypothetical protein B0J11DRAFT_543152 [Dendryphion nanum]
MSVQLSTSLSPKASQDDLLDMAESTFPLKPNCPLRLQKSLEPPCRLKNEHWYNVSSSTNDSAFEGTSNPNPVSISYDSTIRHEPLSQVDYLSHDWQEDDMWSSWRYIVLNARLHEGSSRFENALWRAWAISKYKLKIIPPENINWAKESDHNWLYGPFQSSNCSRSASISGRTISIPKPTRSLGKRQLLRFDERVEQFRAIYLEDTERDWSAESDDDSSYEGLLLKFPLKERAFLHKNTKNITHAGSIIEELPPTTLKSRSPPPEKTFNRLHPPTNPLIDEEEKTEVRFNKCSEAPNGWFTIHNRTPAKHGEKKPPETAKDTSMPFKDAQDDTTGAGSVNELTKVLHKGKDIARAIWRGGWLQLLERVLIQCQSALLALCGVRTNTPPRHKRRYEPCGER